MKTLLSKAPKYIVIGIVFCILILVLINKQIPKSDYSMTTSKPIVEEQNPLSMQVEKNTIQYNISFIARVGEFDTVNVKFHPRLTGKFPFLWFEPTALVQLVDTDKESMQSKTLYTVYGSITNIRSPEFKIRIEDGYSNLIDEMNVKMHQEENIKDSPYYCEKNEDCIPVGCSCTCSGCGGYSYEDVINKKFETQWYEDKKCRKSDICPEVCCSPGKIICENNKCKIVVLDDSIRNE